MLTHLSRTSQDAEKHKECNEYLGELDDTDFTRLVRMGKLITDFKTGQGEEAAVQDTLDDNVGVAVEFEGDEDEDEEDDVDQVVVSSPRQRSVLERGMHEFSGRPSILVMDGVFFSRLTCR